MFKRNPQFIVHLNGDVGIPPISIYEKKFVIGRKPTHPVSIPDSSISRDHLEVIVQDGHIFVMDLETSNGTRVDNQLIPGNIPTPYRSNQTIQLGHSNIVISIELFDENRQKLKTSSTVKPQQAGFSQKSHRSPFEQKKPAQAGFTGSPHQQDHASSAQASSAIQTPAALPQLPPQELVPRGQNTPPWQEQAGFKPTPLHHSGNPKIISPAEIYQNDIESLKQSINTMTVQLEHLKAQTIKHQTEKFAAEAEYNQASSRLEILQTELKSENDKLKAVRHELDARLSQVKEAEEKHKMIVLANQSFVDDTKAALEKAKAREIELNSLVAAAKKENESAQEFAKTHRAEAETYAKALRTEVDEWAKNIRTTTESEIRKKIETLNEETTKLLGERERTYQELKQRHEASLEELKKNEAIKIKNIKGLDAHFKKRTDDFEEAFRQKRDQIERDFYEKREILERDLSDRRTSIERELLQRREELERESADRRAQIENDAQELRSLRDREYKELKAQQDAYLMDVRKREEERLKGIVEESRKVIHDQFQLKNENIQKAFNDFFVDYIKLAPVNMREHLPGLHQDLQKALREALNNELSGEENQIKQLFEYDPKHQKKHKTYWKRLAVATGFMIMVVGYVANNPDSLDVGARFITDSVKHIDLENKKKQADLLEKMKQQSVYKPEQTTTFKTSYTDNVLYTTRYVEFENDEDYKKRWIVDIKQHLIENGQIMDDKADELISKEGALVVALAAEVSGIDARNAEVGIARMRDKENVYVELLTQNLSNEMRQGFNEKKKSLYEQFISDPSKARGPAQSQ